MKTTRQLAEDILEHAKHEIDSTPSDGPALVAQVFAARAQFFATCALTNAVLDVADAIREQSAAEEATR